MTREEAIERIKARFDKWALDDEDTKAIQTLILELAESEDEKIRKALLRCCDDWEKGRYGCMNAVDIPSIRAYLERQKEQNKCPEFCSGHCVGCERNEQKPIFILPDDYEAVMKGIATSIRRKQQEPVVWNDYDKIKQYDSVETGIKDFAVTYSFNIESKLFPQLTKEQQKLWREEIEQAVIAGGNDGVELSRDNRYKENRIEWSEEDKEKN